MLSARGLRSKARGSARFQQIVQRVVAVEGFFIFMTWGFERKNHGKTSRRPLDVGQGPFSQAGVGWPLDSVILNAVKNLGTWRG